MIVLAPSVRRVSHGCARVEQDVRLQIGSLPVFFYEVAIEFTVCLPVDVPDVIALCIPSMLFKLGTEALGA